MPTKSRKVNPYESLAKRSVAKLLKNYKSMTPNRAIKVFLEERLPYHLKNNKKPRSKSKSPKVGCFGGRSKKYRCVKPVNSANIKINLKYK